MDFNPNSINQFHQLVKVSDNKISTDLYCKLTDTRQYLDNKSCHPKHVKQSIPYGQALRIRRICDSDEVVEKRLKELTGDFTKRGFKRNVVESQVRKAKRRSKQSLFSGHSGQRSRNLERIPLVINFHPALSGVNNIIDSLWPILHASGEMKDLFKEKPIVAFRRPRNLKDELVRSKLKRENNIVKGMYKCGKSRCQICKYVDEGCTFEGCNRMYNINFSFDCDSVGVVYQILCKTCNKRYIGSTITSFRKRFNNHKSSMNRFQKGQRDVAGAHLYAHFFKSDHNGIKDFSMKIIDKTNINEPTNRKGFWAYKLDTFIPQGLNVRDFV